MDDPRRNSPGTPPGIWITPRRIGVGLRVGAWLSERVEMGWGPTLFLKCSALLPRGSQAPEGVLDIFPEDCFGPPGSFRQRQGLPGIKSGTALKYTSTFV